MSVTGLRGVPADLWSRVQSVRPCDGSVGCAPPGTPLQFSALRDDHDCSACVVTASFTLKAPKSYPSHLQGSADYLFTARPALSGSAIGVSFQSVNYPLQYITTIQPSNTAEGSARLGVVNPFAALDNASWLITPGLAGAFNSYSLQARDGLVICPWPPHRCVALPCAEHESYTGHCGPLRHSASSTSDRLVCIWQSCRGHSPHARR